MAATPETRGLHFRPKLEIVDRDAVHLVHIHVIAGREQVVRVVGPAQKARGAPLVDDVALLQRTRHHHERQRRLGRRPQPADLAAEVREVARRRRLKLSRRADRVGLPAGHHLVDRRRVVEQPDRRVAHRADQRRAVDHLRQPRQQLGEPNSGQARIDRAEGAGDALRHVRLRVPQVEMARPALEVEQDDAAGPAKTGAMVRVLLRHGVGALLEIQEIGQRETEHRGAADTQQLTAGHAVTGGSSFVAGNHEHERLLAEPAGLSARGLGWAGGQLAQSPLGNSSLCL